jgi:hypothetical protein
MPIGLTNLEQTDNPTVSFPESNYGFPCSSIGNPRNSYCGITMGVDDFASTENDIIVYPNPSSGLVHLNVTNRSVKNIQLFNLQGQFIQEYTSNDFSVAHLPEGMYSITIKTDHSTTLKKLIKK